MSDFPFAIETKPGAFRFRILPPRKWPEGGISVGRPRRWANPYKLKPHGPYEREEAIRLYEADLLAGRLTDPKTGEVLTVAKAIAELRGRPLGCFCRRDEACHADVLLRLANGHPPDDRAASFLDAAKEAGKFVREGEGGG